jgi:hypothetical protein
VATLDIVADQEHGEVIVTRREADGTVVKLICKEEDGPAPAIVPEPHEPQPPPKKGGIFPMLFNSMESVLRVDISDLPRGILRFDPGEFASAAMHRLRLGETEVALTENSASEFGYRGLTEIPLP